MRYILLQEDKYMNMTKSIAKKILILNDKETGAFIKERRKRLGITQVDLAKKLRVSQAEVSNIERGSKKPLSVYEYSQALGVKPQEVISCR